MFLCAAFVPEATLYKHNNIIPFEGFYKSQHEKTATDPFKFIPDKAPDQWDCFSLAQVKRYLVILGSAIHFMGAASFIKYRTII